MRRLYTGRFFCETACEEAWRSTQSPRLRPERTLLANARDTAHPLHLALPASPGRPLAPTRLANDAFASVLIRSDNDAVASPLIGISATMLSHLLLRSQQRWKACATLGQNEWQLHSSQASRKEKGTPLLYAEAPVKPTEKEVYDQHVSEKSLSAACFHKKCHSPAASKGLPLSLHEGILCTR